MARSSRPRSPAVRQPAAANPLPASDLAELAQARRRAFPRKFSVQLATLAQRVPAGEKWLHELKLDGYRLVALIADGQVRLLTRNGHDWTAKFPQLAAAVLRLPIDSAILDGEVVAINERGNADFQQLQNCLKAGTPAAAAVLRLRSPLRPRLRPRRGPARRTQSVALPACCWPRTPPTTA